MGELCGSAIPWSRGWLPRSVVVLPAALALGCAAHLPPSDGHPDLGRALTTVVATAVDGSSVELPQRGHVTVVDVWATWCGPCVESMPLLEALWQDEERAGVRVVGVATDDNPGLVLERARRGSLTYPNVVDASGDVRGWLKVRDLPTLVVFDRAGRVRWVRRGGTAGDLAAARGVVAALRDEDVR